MDFFRIEALAAITLTFVIIWFLIRNHLTSISQRDLRSGGRSSTTLLDQKERCIQLLKDLELDVGMRRVSQPDYHSMRSSLTSELAAILTKLDDLQSLSALERSTTAGVHTSTKP